MKQVILVIVALLLLGAGLIIAGVYLLLGLGFSFVVGGIFAFLAAAILRLGVVANV